MSTVKKRVHQTNFTRGQLTILTSWENRSNRLGVTTKPPSVALLRLRRLVAKRGSKKVLAEKLGIRPSVLSNWLNGSRVPDPTNRAKLQDHYRIGWRLWDEVA